MPTAMITGGASWFSRETAKRLVADGWTVCLSDINEKNLNEVVGEINGGKRVETALLNVTDLESVKKYVNGVIERHSAIDALANVAGGSNYLQMKRIPFHEMKPENWDLIFKPNIYGVLNCCYAVLPHMIKANKGSIVNIASGMALRGQALSSTYSTAKAAIVAFTQSLCQEVGKHNIRVNSIAPGSAESRWAPDLKGGGGTGGLSPLGDRTTAEDVAKAILFLISDRSSHVTGTCLDISGGISLH